MDVEMLRMVERIIVALGGILSVYLGYRVFIVATVNSDSGGTFKSALFSASLTILGTHRAKGRFDGDWPSPPGTNRTERAELLTNFFAAHAGPGHCLEGAQP
jgi:hypothetical protein